MEIEIKVDPKSENMKKVDLIHKECFEILKSTIVKDKKRKRYTIDKDTLLHELPTEVVDKFLDFISGLDSVSLQITFEMIKNGRLTFECWEDEEEGDDSSQVTLRRIKKERKEKLEKKRKKSDSEHFDYDTPFLTHIAVINS